MIKKLTVAFDTDDCLIIPGVATGSGRDTPNYDTIAIFKWFESQGHKMIIWSGSGIDWATTWAEKLGLQAEIRMKQKSEDIDIAFDDCDVDLGKVNIKVKRIENSVSRKEWNKTKRNPEIKVEEPKVDIFKLDPTNSYQGDIDELKALGYEIQTFTQYHHRISKEGYATEVDIWPTNQKYWVKGSLDKSTVYDSLLNTIIEVFSKE